MRLAPKEINAIRTILLDADPSGKIFLFGSRTDDASRGGDIDIFFEPSKPISLKSRLLLEYQLTTECDTKVDLLVKNPHDTEKRFHTIARQGNSL